MDINVEQAEEQLQLCEQISETEGTCYPDDTYEDGIKAALLWALGLGPMPLNAEEYQELMPLQFE
ncbi:hypothetical protein [Aeromonas media]|uniref:hypothetical protein n=1 Tax=Aeromonas media TaxID=651 RepID=UPI00143D7821|nr:hypothetical protein [Aeromonas media]MBS4699342.1 hypothetical protein [Aeromonas media]QIY85836.1 hypothetical protein HFP99_03680 [Aeromonas hydrophila]